MDLKSAVNVWEMRRLAASQVPKDELKRLIDDFISNRANCSLATGYGTQVRNTPMRYTYKNGKFIFLSEGGYKFKGLQHNPHVSIAIYDSNNTNSETHGLTVDGEAIITEYDPTGTGNSNLFMITVTPKTFDYLDSGLPARGYYQLQKLVL